MTASEHEITRKLTMNVRVITSKRERFVFSLLSVELLLHNSRSQPPAANQLNRLSSRIRPTDRERSCERNRSVVHYRAVAASPGLLGPVCGAFG
jgi:hypothetical protein